MDSYRIEITPQARKEIRLLPGNFRQRILREIQSLSQEPLPPSSRKLYFAKTKLRLQPGVELVRIRINPWRIVYLLEEQRELVTVLAIRKRPPYYYEDLDELIADQ